MDLVEQITRKERRIGIIGPGYVGLPLATDHTLYDPDVIVEIAKLVADTRDLVQILNRKGHKLVRRDGH